MENAIKGYVYFVKDTNGYTKIGKTYNINRRMKKYVTENSSPLEFIGSIKYIDFDCGVAEKQFHEYFKSCRVRGEWFKLKRVEELVLMYSKDNFIPPTELVRGIRGRVGREHPSVRKR